ncbi:uncharacterized protein LOC115455569 isoform X1 [Manduca sexta]|uniref:uncharacterized protein LOC115455569 isoform X1 n=2 Tax=Manduca sexta TaxID=7130 RepID=UPI00188F8942|nr:uncharacterized protein LOC115455569 isoform X1 [Manduca sexta]
MDVKYILIVVCVLEWTIAKNNNKIGAYKKNIIGFTRASRNYTSVVLSVFHKQNKSDKDKIYYNEGDYIDFVCELQTQYKIKDYTISMVHVKYRLVPTILYNTNVAFIKYMITAEEIDNRSAVYCSVRKKSKVINNTTSKELFMNHSGQQIGNPIKNIEYYEGNPMRVSCNKGDKLIQKVNEKYVIMYKNIYLNSSDSGSLIFCNSITNKTMKTGIVYTRAIYNKRIYSLTNSQISSKRPGTDQMSVVLKSARQEIVHQPTTYQPATTNEFPPQKSTSIAWKKCYIIGGSMSLVLIILMGILLCLRKKNKEKPPLEVVPDPKYEDIELNTASKQIIYAELELSEESSNTHIFQKINEPQYAQICNLQNNDNK